ncbi:hypothetical protein FA95DRAFT_1573310 [Auriscalpium vulgare]|uniref:Uncharacterized protein n=1 Tax=Auriscalpium vulgare TaxID=40419 RepID=A0ACB8RQ63_9AGAM|nr:hypothetical protein FA95DRAFT_1573310 [Auriscalpium vulgare]
MESLSSTLDTQATSSSAPLPPEPANSTAVPGESAVSAPPSPVKRGPGRPKGSGTKKPVDPNAPLTPKRPVGRPRKDGLPAGSVPRTSSSSTRKRKVAAPGSFAATPVADDGAGPSQPITQADAPSYPASTIPYSYTYSTPQPPWQTTTYSTLSAALQADPPAPLETPAAPPPRPVASTSARAPVAADPLASSDEWLELLREDPMSLLKAVVQAIHAPNPVSRVGLSAEEAFQHHLNTLAPPPGTQAPPYVYGVLKTFWLPSSPAYFSLTASSSTALTPPEHRFFFWDPQPLLFNGIECPFCSMQLHHKGIIRGGPLKVYDLGRPFFIIGAEYRCQNTGCKGRNSPEGRRFASTDPAILRALPPILRDEFPVTMLPGGAAEHTQQWNWQDAGVSKTLWAVVLAGINGGLSKDGTLALLRCCQDGFAAPPAALKREETDGHDKEEVEKVLSQDQMDVAETPTNETAATTYNRDGWKAGDVASTSDSAQPESSSSAAPPATSTAPAVPAPDAPYPQGAPTAYMAYPYAAYPYVYQPPAPASASASAPNPAKRGGDVLDTQTPPAKRVRHCVKCGSKECKGKGGRVFCVNACQDCGSAECKGRNSKRPDKTCADAWPEES